MKTTLTLALGAALLLAPVPVFAQVAAGTVPNSFDRPAQAAPAPVAPATLAAAPDIARSEEVLRDLIADAQGSGFDYAMFTDNLAGQLRQQADQVTPLLKSFGAVRTVAFERPEGQAHLFKVTFDNQETEWLIGFDADDKVAALLFRPAGAE